MRCKICDYKSNEVMFVSCTFDIMIALIIKGIDWRFILLPINYKRTFELHT